MAQTAAAHTGLKRPPAVGFTCSALPELIGVTAKSSEQLQIHIHFRANDEAQSSKDADNFDPAPPRCGYLPIDSLEIAARCMLFLCQQLRLLDRIGIPLKVGPQGLAHSYSSLTIDAYTHLVGDSDVQGLGQLDGILNPFAG